MNLTLVLLRGLAQQKRQTDRLGLTEHNAGTCNQLAFDI